MEDTYWHSHYIFVRFGQVEIQLWPLSWPVLILIAAIALAILATALYACVSWLNLKRD